MGQNKLLDFLQGASNAAASNVSAPVDGIAWLLRKAGVDVGATPLGGSDWMRAKGLTAEPQNKLAGVLGESFGGVAPMLAAAKAPQIARGLLAAGDNLAAPRVLRSESGMFIGPSAKTWDAEAAKKAQTLLARGVAPKQVWKETGTFKGADGALRQEIDDSQAELLAQLPSPQRIKEITGKWMTHNDFLRVAPDTPEALAIRTRNSMTQGKLNGDSPKLPATLNHQALYDAYPSTGSIRMAVKNDMPIGEGAYAQDVDSIILSPLQGPELKSVKLHEIQHAIQQREGWAKGGSPENFNQQDVAKVARDALSWRNELLRLKKEQPNADISALEGKLIQQYDELGAPDWVPTREARDLARQPNVLFPEKYPKSEEGFDDLTELVKAYGLDRRATPYSPDEAYRLLAGEAEARATQARMSMNAAQRREVYPFDSYDVPVDQLIVRGLGQPMNKLRGLMEISK